MIAQKTIQAVYDTAKIEEVVQDFVALKRRGANMLGLCPFHHEKTPSFTVSPSKNFYKCFGCGKGGNVVNFVMEHEKFTFVEAIRYLAKKYSIEIEERERTPEEIQAEQMSDSLYLVNEFARQYFQDQMFDTDKGRSIGLAYFKERGYREDTIRKFGLGYATDAPDAFTQHATRQGYKQDHLQRVGLTTESGRDFFRNRVMFTIFNTTGKPIAFAGRIMTKDVKAPKYINSPETEIYNKSKSLFGLYQARQAIGRLDECILVEGYTDVMTLHQAGIENVVASSGTALTVEQLHLIKRLTPNLKILYDGDPAGVKAALRGLDLALEQDMNVRIALIPGREDPDSYLRQVGASAFQEFISTEARDFILFKTELLLSETKGDPLRKARLVKDIVDSIAHIPDPIKRHIYVQETGRVLQVDEAALMSELNRAISHLMQQAKLRREVTGADEVQEISESAEEVAEIVPGLRAKKTSPKPVGDEMQEKDIARVLVSMGGEWWDEKNSITVAEYILRNLEEVIDAFDHRIYQRIAQETLELLRSKKPVQPQYFINHSDEAIAAEAIELLQIRHEMSPGWEERGIYLRSQKPPDANFSKDSQQALLRFKLRKILRLCDQNQKRLTDLSEKSDPTQMQTFLKVHQRLLQMRDELAKELGTVIIR